MLGRGRSQLVESTLPRFDQELSSKLIKRLLPHTGNSVAYPDQRGTRGRKKRVRRGTWSRRLLSHKNASQCWRSIRPASRLAAAAFSGTRRGWKRLLKNPFCLCKTDTRQPGTCWRRRRDEHADSDTAMQKRPKLRSRFGRNRRRGTVRGPGAQAAGFDYFVLLTCWRGPENELRKV